MLSIHLQDLQFKSFHGLYAQEKILGNTFIVNLIIKYHPASLTIDDIEQTINYEKLFAVVEKRMSIATALLETLAIEIATEVLHTFAMVDEVSITISKQNPPIARFSGNVVVGFTKKRV